MVTGSSIKRSHGFTLVEVMVTMAVIALLALTVSFVVPDRRDTKVEEQARTLYERIKYAREYALVRHAVVGLRIENNASYQFLQFTDKKWQPLNFKGLQATELDENTSLTIETKDIALLEQDNTRLDEIFDPMPQLMIFGSGDMSPFEIQLTDHTTWRSGSQWHITSADGFDVKLARGADE